MRRLPGILMLALLAAGCGADAPPRVTFGAGPTTAVAGPARYCTVEGTDCTADPNAPARLAVPAGTPLQVQVPDEIAETPWQIVFSYRDTAGTRTDARSPVFPPDQRRDYTLQLPAATDQLLTAEVQQYGPPPQADPATGEIQFPIRAAWVLNAASGP